MPVVKELIVHVAKVTNLKALIDSSEYDTKDGIGIVSQFLAPMVKISITMGGQRGSLPAIIKDVAKMLFQKAGLEEKTIETLQINGRTEDNEPRYIDLLNYRMKDSREVKISPGEREASFSERCNALRQAFKHYRDELMKHYSPQHRLKSERNE